MKKKSMHDDGVGVTLVGKSKYIILWLLSIFFTDFNSGDCELRKLIEQFLFYLFKGYQCSIQKAYPDRINLLHNYALSSKSFPESNMTTPWGVAYNVWVYYVQQLFTTI